MFVYAVTCVNQDKIEDVIRIYDAEEKASKHVDNYQAMYNDLGCYLKVTYFKVFQWIEDGIKKRPSFESLSSDVV